VPALRVLAAGVSKWTTIFEKRHADARAECDDEGPIAIAGGAALVLADGSRDSVVVN
jgi:hypothetical protein